MKTTIHTITALLLLTISARGGAISKVHTDKQRATIEARLDAEQELWVFIGDESLGWASSATKAAADVKAARSLRSAACAVHMSAVAANTCTNAAILIMRKSYAVSARKLTPI